MHLVFISTGGTIFQKVDPSTGAMACSLGLFDVLQPQWLQQLQAQQQQRRQAWQQRQQQQQQQGGGAGPTGLPGGQAAGGGPAERQAWPPGGCAARPAPPPVALQSWSHVDLRARSGAELGFETVFAARDAVRQQLQLHRPDQAPGQEQGQDEGQAQGGTVAAGPGSGPGGVGVVKGRGGVCFVLVTGTDTLEEFAFSLDLLLGLELVRGEGRKRLGFWSRGMGGGGWSWGRSGSARLFVLLRTCSSYSRT